MRQNKTKKKIRPFTLIELLVSLVILTVIGGLAIGRGFSIYKEVQTRHSEEKIREEIDFTKVLAITHQMDITIQGFPQGNKYIIIRKADYVPPSLRPYFDRPIAFPGLKIKEEVDCTFYPNNLSSLEFPIKLK